MSHSAAPGQMHKAVTVSDTVNFPDGIARALWFDLAGTYYVVDRFDNALPYTVPAGTQLNMAAKRVNATNTTQTTGIKAWF